MDHPLLRAHGISKRFGATVALDGVDFDVWPGEIHAIVGENGAGKSTLIRILGGVHRPDRGDIFVAGKRCVLASPHDAIAAGILAIPQELRLVPTLSVAENIALGALPVRRLGPIAVVDRARMREQARAVLALLDFHPHLDRQVGSLSFSERQLVAIAKALSRQCRVFILDEPTAALEKREIERLFAVLARMQAHSTGIIYISHRLDEVVAIADRCTVLRDGRVAAVSRRGAFSVTDLIGAMTGRAPEETSAQAIPTGNVLLATRPNASELIELREGQIIGLAGLLGSGADTMLRRLFGMEAPTVVEVRGKRKRVTRPRDAIAAGIGMVPGERRLGLVPNQSVHDNILLPNLDRISRLGCLDRAAGERIVAELMALVDIRPPNPNLKARALSGGNQQKVILAKWLARDIAILLLQDPTQGIDVASKAQIYSFMHDFVARGRAALIHSSDLGELARLCAAVLAVRRNSIAITLGRAGGVDEAKLRAAIGG